MIGQTIAHYKITAKLGEGGMGEVYLATDTKLQRQVALKFLPESLSDDSEARERLLREARAASKLNHPNILTIHAVEEHQGRDFIVMEYIEGNNLSDYLRARSASIDERLALMIQIAEGIGKAHAAAVLHRDIKPSNILVGSDGRAKVLDFGLATFQGAIRLTQIGSTVGTAAYMSPEQAGNRECDQRSDIFSLGVVLYEMVCGRLPFQGGHSAAIMYAILNEDPEPMARYASGVPDELQRIVSKCLAKHAGERYQSAADLIADLKHLIRLSSSGATPAATPRRRMLAVLPFENLGAADDEYFADGITEEIISRLASVTGLGVISRTSAMQYKRTKKSIREIGAELSVDFILEGSVRWSRSSQGPSRVRITPQLIRVTEDTHMWSERYDRVIEDIFDVQSEIAEKVTAQLNVALGEPERRAMEAKPTENMDAYYAYLRGLEYTGRPDYSPENHRLAIQMFERACQLDGGFAQAHAYLAIAHSGMYFYGYDRTDERRAKSAASVEQAVALKPGDPDTHLALGFHHYRCHSDLNRALEDFTRVLQLQPNQVLPLFMTAMIHRRQGRFHEALDRAKNVLQLDPLSAAFALEAGITALIMRRYDEAERLMDRSISLSPDQINAYTWKSGLNLYGRGDIASAQRCLDAIGSGDHLSTFWERLELLLAERDFVAAISHVKALTLEVFEEQNWYRPKSLLIGEAYALLGDTTQAQPAFEEALAHLEKAAADKPTDSRIRIALAHACVGLRRYDEAFRYSSEAADLVPMEKDSLSGPGILAEKASIHALAGDHATALQLIEYLLSVPSWLSPAFLKIGVRWDPLRNNPEFQRVIAQPPKVF